MSDARRKIPSVDRILHDPGVVALLETTPRSLVVEAVRAVLAQARGQGTVPANWSDLVAKEVASRGESSLRSVINATGVILHTNLGRAPLAPEAVKAVAGVAGGYSTLEYDLATGGRGSRLAHSADLLAELTGAEAAMMVNNAAGALVLLLDVLSSGREVVISRGELIEIGGAFRIPTILASSGAVLREVGTTNRTHLSDYAEAIGPETGAVLVVHRSNFEQRGFVATPPPREVAHLALSRGVPSIYDAGSGLLLDLSDCGLRGEPLVPEAVGWGFDAVVFSGDKLLGGPQAGCIVGRTAVLERLKRFPLARALRADKLTLAALLATLALYRDPAVARRTIPVLRMLCTDAEELRNAARALADRIPDQYEPRCEPGSSAVGGGSFPGAELPTTLVSLHAGLEGSERLAARLRSMNPPIIVRVAGNRILLDPRTLLDNEAAILARALQALMEP